MARSLRAAGATPIHGCAVLSSLVISCLVVLLLAQLPTLAHLGMGAAQLSFAAVVAILSICAWYAPAGPPPFAPSDDASATIASHCRVRHTSSCSRLKLSRYAWERWPSNEAAWSA